MQLKMGKKIHLCEFEADSLAEDLTNLFDRWVDVERIKHTRANKHKLLSEDLGNQPYSKK